MKEKLGEAYDNLKILQENAQNFQEKMDEQRINHETEINQLFVKSQSA